MKKIILKSMILVLVILVNDLYAQTDKDLDKILKGTGEYVPNHYGDKMLGFWKSMDGNYFFKIEKKIVHLKRGTINFKTDQLILTLIDVKSKNIKNSKNINSQIPFVISNGSASSIYEDSDTKKPVEIILYFRNINKIEMFTKNSMLADKKNELFFPEKLILIRNN